MPFEDRILDVIKAVMPANAEIQVVPGYGSLTVTVFWKLNDDPKRPNKMSKTIAICVSEEAVQNFASAWQGNPEIAYERVSRFLAQKLAKFDPTHDAPKYVAPPVERWVINTQVVGD